MKTQKVVLALLLVMSVGIDFGSAQVVQPELQSRPAEKKFDLAIQDLELTDEQEAQITAIRKEYRANFQKAAQELNILSEAEINKIQNALTPEQRSKIKDMLPERAKFKVESLAQTIAGLKELDLTEAELAQVREIRNENRAKMEAAVKQLDGLLTDAQKKTREEGIEAGKSRREILQSLNLTSEQTVKVKSVGSELKALVSQEAERIREVLNAGQEEELQELAEERKETVRDRLAHKIANLRELNLTDQEEASLRSIRQEYRPKLREAGNNLRASIAEEMGKIGDVLRPAGAVAERPDRAK